MLSNLPKIKIKKVLPDATLPTRAHSTDSGLDLHACRFEKVFFPTDTDKESTREMTSEEELCLIPGCRALVHTGISATVGVGYEIQIRPRSGYALKQGLTVLNTPGTIDESYRGPLCVILINQSGVPQIIKKGDRIAQMVACPVALCEVEEVLDLDSTARNEGGFGSTGV
jgi:dUTP pyrophosphatase